MNERNKEYTKTKAKKGKKEGKFKENEFEVSYK